MTALAQGIYPNLKQQLAETENFISFESRQKPVAVWKRSPQSSKFPKVDNYALSREIRNWKKNYPQEAVFSR